MYKGFAIIVYNIEYVPVEKVKELAEKIESETGYKIYQMGHADSDASPLYVTSLERISHDTPST